MVDMSRIDRLLRVKGWSNAELARRLGVNTSITSDWRRGKSSPDKYLNDIVRHLDTTEAYLLGETDDPRPETEKSPVGHDEAVLLATRITQLSAEDRQRVEDYLRLLESQQGK